MPVDPLPVRGIYIFNCRADRGVETARPSAQLSDAEKIRKILTRLPDNSVRVAVRDVSGGGSIGFGGSNIGAEGKSYNVILDYINNDVANIRFRAEEI